jgi:hypothetical protein
MILGIIVPPSLSFTPAKAHGTVPWKHAFGPSVGITHIVSGSGRFADAQAEERTTGGTRELKPNRSLALVFAGESIAIQVV